MKCIPIIILLPIFALAAEPLNVATPDRHPYADATGGREGYTLANKEVNEARLYDFYQRQADYYMAQGDIPALMPAYPGLAGNQFGHWGKYNQNNHNDGRWNDMDLGGMLSGQIRQDKTVMKKGVALELDGLRTCFDPMTLNYRWVWEGGLVSFNPFRWGLSRGATVDGKLLQENGIENVWGQGGQFPQLDWKLQDYRGYYRHGKQVVFHYGAAGTVLLDHPHAIGKWFCRTLQFQEPGTSVELQFMQLPDGLSDIESRSDGAYQLVIAQNASTCWIGCVQGQARLRFGVNSFIASVDEAQAGDRFRVATWTGPKAEAQVMIKQLKRSLAPVDLTPLLKGGPAHWPERITASGTRAKDDKPYVVDSLPVPFENPYKAGMLLSGIDFTPDGAAYITTLWGDVWQVTGIDDSLKQVTWKRFAAGLSQPFGVKYSDGQLFVLCKDQITILHDYNGDGEADYYENYANDFMEDHGHTHVFGLDRDKEGNFYFPAYDLYHKVPGYGGPTELFAKGFRNCMGSTVRDDGLVLASSQEGTWTPASQIIEVIRGEHYGHKRANEPIAEAMCWIPRGVDNSTGGMVFLNDDRWGPLGQSLIGLSYGYGSHYLILLDETNPRRQAATVPLDGEFSSGVVRGRIHPVDGQFYVVGTEGWGNYGIDDGCLNRIRYTGQKLYKPIGWQAHYNGIRIDFTEAVDPASAKDLRNIFAAQWNYEYAKRYGSPEFSVFQPNQLGHDRVEISAVHVLNEGRSIFIEMPWILPVMQMQIRMHLKAKDGTAFKTDLFPSVKTLGAPFDFDGQATRVEGKPTQLQIRIKQDGKKVVREVAKRPETVDRELTLNAVLGLQYEQTTLKVKTGEVVALTLANSDALPHNWVLVQPGAYEKVGMASFKMLTDPQVAEKHYVPELPEVIAFTETVFPEKKYTVYFKIEQAGSYPYMCTFPGHWQAMKGTLIVE
jgi:azurin